MNRAAKGSTRERAIRHALEGLGYTVIRAAGSKGPCDLVAWLPILTARVVFIQIKSDIWMPEHERMLMSQVCPPTRLAVRWGNQKKPGASSDIEVRVIDESGGFQPCVSESEVRLEVAIRKAGKASLTKASPPKPRRHTSGS